MIRSQADQRAHYECLDQHGRVWESVFEVMSKGMVGAISPKGWRAPFREWLPPQKYLKQVDPRRDFTRLEVNYAGWRNDNLRAWRDYETEVNRVVTTIPGAAVDKDGKLNTIAYAEVGRAPMPTAVIDAMEQGNAYALGLSDVVDERLRPYMPLPDHKRNRVVLDFSGPPVHSGPVNVPPAEESSLTCEYCDHEPFKSVSGLKSHLRTHAHDPVTTEV